MYNDNNNNTAHNINYLKTIQYILVVFVKEKTIFNTTLK